MDVRMPLMDGVGQSGRGLAVHLREWSRRYDMKTTKSVLQETDVQWGSTCRGWEDGMGWAQSKRMLLWRSRRRSAHMGRKTSYRLSPTFAALVTLWALYSPPAEAVRPYQPVHPDPVTQPWRWRIFDELKGQGLKCLAEARDGAIWFGVDRGVLRYDGVRWTPFTPDDGIYGAPVRALCAARDGSVYAGTERGISRFFQKVWERVFPPEGDVPWPIFDLMEAGDGSIWAATAWGALRLGPAGPTLYTSSDVADAVRMLDARIAVSVVPDAPVRPWSEGVGIAVTRGEWQHVDRCNVPWVVCGLAEGGPGEAAGLQIGDRITAVDGQPISGDLSGPADTPVRLTLQREGRPDPFDLTLSRSRLPGGFREFQVFDVFEDRDGRIWLGLLQGELLSFTPSDTGTGGTGWRLHSGDDGLQVGEQPRVAQTQDGAIWSVSNSRAHPFNRFDGTGWTSVTLNLKAGDHSNTSILETADGTLWVGGMDLHRFDDGRWRTYRPVEVPVPFHRTRLLEASDGALWIAGLGLEAARLDFGPNRWTIYGGLRFMCETPDGARWFVSRDHTAVRQTPAGSGSQWLRYGVEDGLMDNPYRAPGDPNRRIVGLRLPSRVFGDRPLRWEALGDADAPRCVLEPPSRMFPVLKLGYGT
jgi:hypothetical protein